MCFDPTSLARRACLGRARLDALAQRYDFQRVFMVLKRSFGLILLSASAHAFSTMHASEVNVYSSRHYDTDRALYESFTEQTGIGVNLTEGGGDDLIDRIVAEGSNTSADLLITVDAARLWLAQQRGVFQPIKSIILEERIPMHLREEEGHWFGLSKRARVIVLARNREWPTSIDRYEDLASKLLRDRICMRSSSNIYNRSLMSSLIEANGLEAAGRWASQVVANFAHAPQGNDTGNLEAVAAGECDVTISNSYYLGRLLASELESSRSLVAKLQVVFPNQDDRGAHVNISGAGVIRHAPNRSHAIRFLEYLSSDYAQRLFAEGNNEYPVIGETTGPISSLGAFKEDVVHVQIFGEKQAEAVGVYDRAGWR